jgi:PqqD family protein of HPr-rel-A system
MKIWSATVDHFRLRDFDGEMVVFDNRSGDTHALDPLATALVLTLQRRSATSLPELCEVVAPKLEEDERAIPQSVVLEALALLERLQLVASFEQ